MNSGDQKKTSTKSTKEQMKGGQKKSDLKRSRWFPVCLITQVQLQLRYLSTCRLMGSLTGWMDADQSDG